MQEQLFQFRVGLLILAIALQLTGKNITDGLVNLGFGQGKVSAGPQWPFLTVVGMLWLIPYLRSLFQSVMGTIPECLSRNTPQAHCSIITIILRVLIQA